MVWPGSRQGCEVASAEQPNVSTALAVRRDNPAYCTRYTFRMFLTALPHIKRLVNRDLTFQQAVVFGLSSEHSLITNSNGP